MDVWFDNDDKIAALSKHEPLSEANARHCTAPQSPTVKDFDEAADWLSEKISKSAKIVKFLFGAAALLAFLFSTFAPLSNKLVAPIFSTSLFLFVAALSIAIAQKLQTKLNTQSPRLSLQAISLTLYQTTATTFAVALIVLLSLPLFVLPGLFALVSLVRAPYLAAQGHSPLEALKQSYTQRRILPKVHLELGITIINAILSSVFMVYLFEIVGPIIPWGLEDLVFYLVVGSILSSVWNRVFAVHLVGDAILKGIIDEESMRKYRKPVSFFSHLNHGLSKLSPLLVLVVFLVLSQKKGGDTNPSQRELHWTMEEVGGKKATSESYADKAIVLYAWAPWCLPCKVQIPHVKKLYDEKGDQYHVLSVALSYKSRQEVDDYQKTFGLPYPIFYGTNAFQELAKVSVFPTVMIIQKGKILRRWTGITSANSVKRALVEIESR